MIMKFQRNTRIFRGSIFKKQIPIYRPFSLVVYGNTKGNWEYNKKGDGEGVHS